MPLTACALVIPRMTALARTSLQQVGNDTSANEIESFAVVTVLPAESTTATVIALAIFTPAFTCCGCCLKASPVAEPTVMSKLLLTAHDLLAGQPLNDHFTPAVLTLMLLKVAMPLIAAIELVTLELMP